MLLSGSSLPALVMHRMYPDPRRRPSVYLTGRTGIEHFQRRIAALFLEFVGFPNRIGFFKFVLPVFGLRGVFRGVSQAFA